MKIKLIKINRPSRFKYSVKDVTSDKKRGYFIITTKIYQHEFIETIPFTDCDLIECYEDRTEYGMCIFENKEKVIKVVYANEKED